MGIRRQFSNSKAISGTLSFTGIRRSHIPNSRKIALISIPGPIRRVASPALGLTVMDPNCSRHEPRQSRTQQYECEASTMHRTSWFLALAFCVLGHASLAQTGGSGVKQGDTLAEFVKADWSKGLKVRAKRADLGDCRRSVRLSFEGEEDRRHSRSADGI